MKEEEIRCERCGSKERTKAGRLIHESSCPILRRFYDKIEGESMTKANYVHAERSCYCPMCGWTGGEFCCQHEDREVGTTSYNTPDGGIVTEPNVVPVPICPDCQTEVELGELYVRPMSKNSERDDGTPSDTEEPPQEQVE